MPGAPPEAKQLLPAGRRRVRRPPGRPRSGRHPSRARSRLPGDHRRRVQAASRPRPCSTAAGAGRAANEPLFPVRRRPCPSPPAGGRRLADAWPAARAELPGLQLQPVAHHRGDGGADDAGARVDGALSAAIVRRRTTTPVLRGRRARQSGPAGWRRRRGWHQPERWQWWSRHGPAAVAAPAGHRERGPDVGKTWNYIKTWFGKKTEDIKDPEIEIEQAIQEAQKRDQELRNQAAQVIAHRTNVAVRAGGGLRRHGRGQGAGQAGAAAGRRRDQGRQRRRGREVEHHRLADRDEDAGLAEHRRHAHQAARRRPTSRPRRPRRRSRPTPSRCRSWRPSACSCSASSSRPRCRRASTRPWTP